MSSAEATIRLGKAIAAVAVSVVLGACAPKITAVSPVEGHPGTLVSLSMTHLVGWPRIEIAGHTIYWPDLRLSSAAAGNEAVRGEDLIWIEDKILQFRIPEVPPGRYIITVHDDKGPPGQPAYSLLETAAYVAFPPVWPFVFRPNQARTHLTILPSPAPTAP